MYMDRIPKFGYILSCIDHDMLVWLRGCSSTLDTNTLEAIKRGDKEVIAFNIKSTKQLISIMQQIIYSNEVQGNHWLDRKIKCDGLLDLCERLLEV